MDVRHALTRSQGIAYARDLLSQGVSRHDLSRAVETGTVVRLRSGLFAFEADSNMANAARHGGTATCVTALRHYGVWVLYDGPENHVHVPVGSRIHPHPECSCVTHRTPIRRPFGFMPVREALVHAAQCLSSEAFFAAFESAWFQRLLSRSDRTWIRSRVPTRLRVLLDFARPDAESGLESLLRLRLRAVGITLRTQVLVPGVGRVDFVIDDLIVEVDGALGHADSRSRHKDLLRDARAAQAGYHTLRFDYALVIHQWPEVLGAILGALKQR